MSTMTFLSIINRRLPLCLKYFNIFVDQTLSPWSLKNGHKHWTTNLSMYFDYQYDISTVVQDFLFTLAQLQT